MNNDTIKHCDNFTYIDNFQNESLDDESNSARICITVSCCSAGIFSVEVWTHTICREITTEKGIKRTKLTLNLKAKESITKSFKNSKLEVLKDVVLPVKDENGNFYILNKGDYKLVDNQLIFYPTDSLNDTNQKRKFCYTVEVRGEFLGNPYDYSVTVCVDFHTKSDYGLVTLTPKFTSKQLSQVSSFEKNNVSFKEDIIVKDKNNGYNFIIKAGNYTVNKDGNIYMPNIKIKQ